MMAYREEVVGVEGVAQHVWETWVKENRKRLVFHARSILGNYDDAEDAVQSLLCRLWRNRHRLTSVKTVERYMITSARNEARNLLRTRRIERQFVVVDEVVENHDLQAIQDPLAALEAAELAAVLLILQKRLSWAQQRLFHALQDDPGKSGRALAAELGCSHKNVQGLLKRMRRTLGQILEMPAAAL